MSAEDDQVVVPIVREELVADAVPVVTGGVRVVKHTQRSDQVIEQELRRGTVNVKRVPTHRIVDGPQTPYREGDTLIVPVVSETLRIQREWVVTEEIHITETEAKELYRQAVPVSTESASVERFDSAGNTLATEEISSEQHQLESAAVRPAASERVLSNTQPILRRPRSNS